MRSDLLSFATDFSCLTGYSPMRWQCRLFDLFVDGKIPAALDLPTGLGKTSVMTIWLLARALAGKETLKTIPRRLVYIVDRRAVVDQATEEARKLHEALKGAAAHLKEALGLDGCELPISTLRGQHVDKREWLNDPAAPAIIVGTVDMIGSRLLFEGYGVSRKMRPYHAGLLGADTLIVLDEAHLVPPFEALLWQIANGASEFGPRGDEHAGIVPPFRLLSLSATGRALPSADNTGEAGVFRLEDNDMSDTIVKERLSAKKAVSFEETGNEKDALAETLSRQAWMLSEEGGKPVRCLVYCDSRECAEKVKEGLDKLALPNRKGDDPKADTELFVGARRIWEREGAKAWLRDHGFLAGSQPPVRPAFLIATSAGEVGIDLDADHMVCDLVPWERMVQRLGRVNRRGAGNARIVIVHGGESKAKKADSPTEQEKRQAIGFHSYAVFDELPVIDGGRDASPDALRGLKLRAESDEMLSRKIEEATTPELLRPALTRALVDAWSMTSLETHTGRPKIAPWLRGWIDENEDAQTTVIWRTHLPFRKEVDALRGGLIDKPEIDAFFEAAASHESEKLETSTWRIVDWLLVRAKSLSKDALRIAKAVDVDPEVLTDDVLTADMAKAVARPLLLDNMAVYVLSPAGDYSAGYTLGALADERNKRLKGDLNASLVGMTLVVDARFGGLDAGMLTRADGGEIETADASDDWSREAKFRVRQTTSDDYKSEDDNWRFENDFVLGRDSSGEPVDWLVVEHYRSAAQSEDARSISKPQELAKHQNWAEQKARKIAAEVGLSGIAFEVLSLAARLHDEGKRAEKWQNAFRARRDAARCCLTGPLAKTTGFTPNLLDGYRHEFGSLAVFDSSHDWAKALPDELRQRLEALQPSDGWFDLLQHLVVSHHGFGRPVIGTHGCEDAPPTTLESRARDVALRFARLQTRWGPWGLAWWEALLRAADQQASRANDEGEDLDAPHTGKNDG